MREARAVFGSWKPPDGGELTPSATEPPLVLSEQQMARKGFEALGALLVTGFVLISFLLMYGYLRLRRQRLIREARSFRLSSSAAQQEVDESPAQRYHVIESWLISKTVQSHDELCDAVLAESSTTSTSRSQLKQASATTRLGRSNTADTDVFTMEDDEECSGSADAMECPICYEAYSVGDVVSWSPNPGCDHVFHHHCIKEWLLRNDSCPSCRNIYLPTDNNDGRHIRGLQKQIQDLILAQQHRSTACFFCLRHGIARPPRRMFTAQHGTDTAPNNAVLQKCVEATPAKERLVELRGVHHNDSSSCCQCLGGDEEGLRAPTVDDGSTAVRDDETNESPDTALMETVEEEVDVDEEMGVAVLVNDGKEGM